MENESIWIAKGFIVSSDPNISKEEILNKTDKGLLELICPIVKNLETLDIVERWYSSRGDPGIKIKKWRVRIYIKTAKVNKEAVLEIINKQCINIEIVTEKISEESDVNSDIKQISSEIALKLLPKALELNRSEEFLKILDPIVNSNKKIQNKDGIHYLETNLGYTYGSLMKRYLNITEIF